MKSLKKCNATQLESCATFLGFVVRNDENEKLYRNQDILTDRIILKIESLFETQCNDCNQTYQNTLEDTPPLKCILCMQGSHNCASISTKIDAMGEETPVGTSWLCFGCLVKNNLALNPPPKQKKKVRTNSTVSVSESLPTIPENDDQREEVEENEEDDIEERESPRRGRETEPEDRPAASVRADPKEICELYKRRNCPHGRLGKTLVNGKQCEKSHPPRCFKYTRFGARNPQGCNKGANCQYWHPRLCKESLKSKRCTKDDCSFFHIKGTMRSSLDQADDSQRHAPTRKDSVRPLPPTNKSWPIPRFSISDATPYPPTVQQRSRPEAQIRNDESFLLHKIENMKQGFNDQITDLVQNDIPKLLRELIKEALQTQPTAPPQQAINAFPVTQKAPTHSMMYPPQIPQWYSQQFPPLC